jgi:hypothetical protein
VQDAVAAKLQEVTPEKLEQFELLIQDHRSIQRLADETLNDEHVVTAENANQLLEAMRQATIEEEKAALEATLTADRQKMNKRHRVDVNARREAEARADAANIALAAAEAREQNRVNRALNRADRLLAVIDIVILALLLFLGGLAAYDWFYRRPEEIPGVENCGRRCWPAWAVSPDRAYSRKAPSWNRKPP